MATFRRSDAVIVIFHVEDSQTWIDRIANAVERANDPRVRFRHFVARNKAEADQLYARRRTRDYNVMLTEKVVGGDNLEQAIRDGVYADIPRIFFSSTPPSPDIVGTRFVDKDNGTTPPARRALAEVQAEVIDDPYIIQFSDQKVRVNADVMVQCYNASVMLLDRWAALGSGQAALDVMEMDIRRTADAFLRQTSSSETSSEYVRGQWFANGFNSSIPNDSTRILDGSPEDGRPENLGQYVHGILNRAIEWWTRWSPGNDGAAWNTILFSSSGGEEVLSVATAQNFLTRCGELKADYEANGSVNLESLLRLAVNTTPSWLRS